jgi:hypothetical protein
MYISTTFHKTYVLPTNAFVYYCQRGGNLEVIHTDYKKHITLGIVLTVALWTWEIRCKVQLGMFFYVFGISNGLLLLRHFWCIYGDLMNVELWGHWLNESWIGENWLLAWAHSQAKFLDESQVSQLCAWLAPWAKETNLKLGVGCTRGGVSHLP